MRVKIKILKESLDNGISNLVTYHCGTKTPDEPWNPSGHLYSGEEYFGNMPLGAGIYFGENAKIYCKTMKDKGKLPFLYKVSIDMSQVLPKRSLDSLSYKGMEIRNNFISYDFVEDIDFYKIFNKDQKPEDVEAVHQKLSKIGITGRAEMIANGYPEVAVYDPKIITVLDVKPAFSEDDVAKKYTFVTYLDMENRKFQVYNATYWHLYKQGFTDSLSKWLLKNSPSFQEYYKKVLEAGKEIDSKMTIQVSNAWDIFKALDKINTEFFTARMDNPEILDKIEAGKYDEQVKRYLSKITNKNFITNLEIVAPFNKKIEEMLRKIQY